MSREASKAMGRRGEEYFKYFSGNGIDVGCGPDPVDAWRGKFSGMGSVRKWDMPEGDAQKLISLNYNQFDWLHSSHSLEHMKSWSDALKRWMDVIKPGGYCIVTVPSWEMYEHRVWPSRFNSDHKWSFSLVEPSNRHIVNLNTLKLSEFGKVLILQEITDGYDPTSDRDQTLGSAECCIEFVLQKRTKNELV